jgi:hypothetical protein
MADQAGGYLSGYEGSQFDGRQLHGFTSWRSAGPFRRRLLMAAAFLSVKEGLGIRCATTSVHCRNLERENNNDCARDY